MTATGGGWPAPGVAAVVGLLLMGFSTTLTPILIGREEIIRAAVAYFAEVGFGGSTRELAQRAGVTQALLIPNWIAGLAGLVAVLALYAVRQSREEAMMRDTFGAEYDAYCARTKRLVPGVF